MKTCWRDLIAEELKARGESWDDVVESTLDDQGLDRRFNSGYGSEEGEGFTLWTGRRVYFPVGYDGAEWAGSVPRDPCGETTGHIGGG